MECKDQTLSNDSEGGEVLIETYWNVKLGTTAAMSLTSGINRNILECKDEIKRKGSTGFPY